MVKDKKTTKKYQRMIEKRAVKKAFRDWSTAVRHRDNNSCAICGATKFIHAHHLIPRENKVYRFDVDNGITLCALHHKYSLEISAHRHPIAFSLWLQNKRPFQWAKCKVRILNPEAFIP